MPPKSRRRNNQDHAATAYLPPDDLEVDSDHLGLMAYGAQPHVNVQTQALTNRSPDELNFSVLKRHYPSVQHIHGNAPYAVIYTFSAQSQTWEKSGCEGTLFLVQLEPDETAEERYATIVLNRRGLDNFVVELKTEEDIQITEEYVILQGQAEPEDRVDPGEPPGSAQVIYGLWIYSEAESSTARSREYIANTILEFAQRAEASRSARMSLAADVAALSPPAQQYEQPQVQQQQQQPAYQEGDLRAMLGLQRNNESAFRAPVQQQAQGYGFPQSQLAFQGQPQFQQGFSHPQSYHQLQQQQMYPGAYNAYAAGAPNPGGAYHWQFPR